MMKLLLLIQYVIKLNHTVPKPAIKKHTQITAYGVLFVFNHPTVLYSTVREAQLLLLLIINTSLWEMFEGAMDTLID